MICQLICDFAIKNYEFAIFDCDYEHLFCEKGIILCVIFRNFASHLLTKKTRINYEEIMVLQPNVRFIDEFSNFCSMW